METDRPVVPPEMGTGPDSVTGRATEAAVAVETVASAERKVEHLENTDPSFGVDEADSAVEAGDFQAVPQVPLQSRVLHFYNSCLFFIWSLEKIKHWIGFCICQVRVVLSGTEKPCYVTVLLILPTLNYEKTCFTVLITDELRWLHNM